MSDAPKLPKGLPVESFDPGDLVYTAKDMEDFRAAGERAARAAEREALIAEADATVDKLRALHKHTMGYEDACVARGAELVADALRARAESEAGHG